MFDDSEFSEDDLAELSLLRDFEVDELIKAGLLGEDEQLTAPLDEEIVFKHEELSLHVTAGPLYPAVPVIWRIENHMLSRQVIDELRAQSRQFAEAAAITNNISRWRSREEESAFGIFKPTMVVLEFAKRTTNCLKEWRGKALKRKPVIKPEKSYLPPKTKLKKSTMTISNLSSYYLQETPQEICSRISSDFRILHVEEVLRDDLARRFQEKQEEMRIMLLKEDYDTLRECVPSGQQYVRRKTVLVEHLVKPRVAFHGTDREYMSSIVRYGLLQPGKRNPGTNEVHETRCGATYGRGIYSSPEADYALRYAGHTCHATKPNQYFGIKLLVCAMIMGRSANIWCQDNWRTQSEPYPGADSHVAYGGLEYIVFDTAQILSVYVVHIDWGRDNISHFGALPWDLFNFGPSRGRRYNELLESLHWCEDVKRERAAAFARASKWFPYGYGPSTGAKFVVEEVGEVDEDEEYGDYQELNEFQWVGDGDKSTSDFWRWLKLGVEMDVADRGDPASEYTRQRHWHGPETWMLTEV
ncbi:ADP-ribosylation [Jackrogersella minutella]|nr:ADP-ribosylation [Jackrogersella minutella]